MNATALSRVCAYVIRVKARTKSIMTEVEIQLKLAVERMHTCKATLAQSVPVRERHGDMTVWEGVVHVFDLKGRLCLVLADRGKR